MVDPFIVPIQECGEKCAATGSHKAFPVFQTTATAYFRETYMYPEAPVTRIDFGAIFQSVMVWSRLVCPRTTVIELVQS